MKNTAHFGLTAAGKLINLGVGANTREVANLLADNAESVAAANGKNIDVVALLDISDLYLLKSQITDALNALDNDALAGEVEHFGTLTEFTD